MKLKIDENGGVVLDDGKPVYVHEDGKEVAFDAKAAMVRMNNLSEEKDRHYNNYQKAAEQLKTFEGFDIEEASKAMEIVKNLDDKKLVDAGEIDTLKKNLGEIHEKDKSNLVEKHKLEMSKVMQEIEAVQEKHRNMVIESNFSKSPYFSGEKPKTILPPDMATEYFGKYFTIEEQNGQSKLVGKWNNEPIISEDPNNYGSPAGFEEAIGFLIERYPMKERILRSAGAGSGGSGNTEFTSDTKAVYLSQEDATDPKKYRMAKAQAEEKGIPIIIRSRS